MSAPISVARAGIWSAVLQWSRLGLNAVIFVILSRWLTLAEIGAVAAAQAPIQFLQSLQNAAFPDAVIQEPRSDRLAQSTLFWIAAVFGTCASLILFVGAIGLMLVDLDGAKAVGLYLACLSVVPIITALGVIKDGRLRRVLDTRALAIRTTLAAFLAGILALGAGYWGLGGWALVLFAVANAALSTAMLFVVDDWRPAWRFDRPLARQLRPVLFSLVGRYAVGAAVLPILQVAIMASLGAAASGTFQLAQRVFGLLDALMVTPIRFISLPAFARVREQPELLPARLVRSIGVASLLAVPAYMGTAAIAPELMPLLLGKANGAPTVPILQLLVLYGPPSLIISLVNAALTSRGLAVVVFQRAVVIAIATLVPALIAAQFSVFAVAAVYSGVAGVVGVLLAILLGHRYLSLPMPPLIAAILRSLSAAAAMVAVIVAIGSALPPLTPIIRLAVLIAAGGATYAAAAALVMRGEVLALLRDVRRESARGPQPPAA